MRFKVSRGCINFDSFFEIRAYRRDINIQVGILHMYKMYCVWFSLPAYNWAGFITAVWCVRGWELATGGPGQINMCTRVGVGCVCVCLSAAFNVSPEVTAASFTISAETTATMTTVYRRDKNIFPLLRHKSEWISGLFFLSSTPAKYLEMHRAAFTAVLSSTWG